MITSTNASIFIIILASAAFYRHHYRQWLASTPSSIINIIVFILIIELTTTIDIKLLYPDCPAQSARVSIYYKESCREETINVRQSVKHFKQLMQSFFGIAPANMCLWYYDQVNLSSSSFFPPFFGTR